MAAAGPRQMGGRSPPSAGHKDTHAEQEKPRRFAWAENRSRGGRARLPPHPARPPASAWGPGEPPQGRPGWPPSVLSPECHRPPPGLVTAPGLNGAELLLRAWDLLGHQQADDSMSPFGARWEAAEEGGEGQGVAQGLSMPPLGCPGHLHRSRRVNVGSPQWGCRPDALNKEEVMPRLGAVWVRPAVWPAPAEGATPRSSLRDRPSPGAEMDKGCTRGRAEPELACRPRGFPGTPRRDRVEGSEGPWSKGRS